MADCRDTITQLYAYLDQMLDDELRRDIDRHLGDCPDCQGHMEFEFSLKARIRSRAATEPIPDDLEQRLRDCLNVDLDAD